VGDESVRPASVLIFFKTYTEKVWGIPCSELRAEWAAQRIKELSLKTVLLHLVVRSGTTITTLIDEFEYPGSVRE